MRSSQHGLNFRMNLFGFSTFLLSNSSFQCFQFRYSLGLFRLCKERHIRTSCFVWQNDPHSTLDKPITVRIKIRTTPVQPPPEACESSSAAYDSMTSFASSSFGQSFSGGSTNSTVIRFVSVAKSIDTLSVASPKIEISTQAVNPAVLRKLQFSDSNPCPFQQH